MTVPDWRNKLYFGDNLDILREHVADESIDLIYLDPPTRPMLQEAASAGIYEPGRFPGYQFPRLQILTIEELMSGKEAQYPHFAPQATFRQAPRRRRKEGAQGRFA